MAEVETPPVEELERMFALGEKEAIPCRALGPGETCDRPAVAWTFWNCTRCNRVRMGACADHLVWVVTRNIENRGNWQHIKCDNARMTYLGHAEIG